jgi:hypothetical protein
MANDRQSKGVNAVRSECDESVSRMRLFMQKRETASFKKERTGLQTKKAKDRLPDLLAYLKLPNDIEECATSIEQTKRDNKISFGSFFDKMNDCKLIKNQL